MFLYCIRHGQSTYNAEKRIQGQSDVPLSEMGRAQGAAVARAMAAVPLDAVFASPLRRAKDTALMVAAVHGLPVQTDERLKEVHAGLFQDRMSKEIHQEYPGMIARWRSGDPDFVFPEGESRQSVIDRGREALLAICQNGYSHAAVVSHGGLLLAGIKSLLGLQSTDPPFELGNTSITKLEVSGRGGVELVYFDRAYHLVGGTISSS